MKSSGYVKCKVIVIVVEAVFLKKQKDQNVRQLRVSILCFMVATNIIFQNLISFKKTGFGADVHTAALSWDCLVKILFSISRSYFVKYLILSKYSKIWN